ncbi:MAG TPA: ABC transporter substrate-binding protein [Burkholderiales bacterium]|jgi:putative ABC transport system substrate-binding protein|nr:ABC transporter substrate-binding protein [Burkholderiales bacterium]
MRVARVLVATLLLAFALPSSAQTPARIAWIWPGSAKSSEAFLSAFRQGMSENGLSEGKNFVIEQRFGEGRYERFPDLVKELLEHKPAVIMAVTIASVRAAQKATQTIPIVFVSTNDPVGSGLVKSLSRPGGNTTGLSNQNEDLVPKYVELLRETLPRVSRLAILMNPDNPSNPKMAERVRDFSTGFGISVMVFSAVSPQRLGAAFGQMAGYRPDALLVVPDFVFFDQRERIGAFALSQGVPVFAQQSEMVASGSLMSYGTERRELYRRAATYVKKILDGAKPADLPVEQPIRFELIVNLKTAKALGIRIPQPVLLRADQVIE